MFFSFLQLSQSKFRLNHFLHFANTLTHKRASINANPFYSVGPLTQYLKLGFHPKIYGAIPAHGSEGSQTFSPVWKWRDKTRSKIKWKDNWIWPLEEEAEAAIREIWGLLPVF